MSDDTEISISVNNIKVIRNTSCHFSHDKYGKIQIVVLNTFQVDDTHKSITYKQKMDLFNVPLLNEYLDELDEYIICGIYGGMEACLITNTGSLFK